MEWPSLLISLLISCKGRSRRSGVRGLGCTEKSGEGWCYGSFGSTLWGWRPVCILMYDQQLVGSNASKSNAAMGVPDGCALLYLQLDCITLSNRVHLCVIKGTLHAHTIRPI